MRNDPQRIVAWHAIDSTLEEIKRVVKFKGCCDAKSINASGPTRNVSELVFLGLQAGGPKANCLETAALQKSAPGEAESLAQSDKNYFMRRATRGVGAR